jgi:hypothetical protein
VFYYSYFYKNNEKDKIMRYFTFVKALTIVGVLATTITSNTYWDWYLDHAFLLLPAADYVGRFLMTFKEYPPRMKAASFNLDNVMEQLNAPTNN